MSLNDLSRSCLGKKKYKSESQVKHAAKIRSKTIDIKLNYYYCVYCGGYHLTKKEPK